MEAAVVREAQRVILVTDRMAHAFRCQYADLPRASSLCGACNEVCPVDIPLPELLLRLRDRGKREGAKPAGAAPSMTMFAHVATRPGAWRQALRAGRLLGLLPGPLRPRALRVWGQDHALPPWRGGVFRKWMAERKTQGKAITRKAP